MEMDPTQELKGTMVVRLKDRKLPVYNVSRITFFPALIAFIDCLLPSCGGHPKYGIVEDENIPVVFRFHDFNMAPVYVPFRCPINRPFRVPLDGDLLLNGIKWRFDPSSLLTTVQCLFDCLMANLRLQSLTKEFCLECLLSHTIGHGVGLERLLRTILYHIIPFGRHSDKELFRPITCFENGMNFRFRRIFWKDRNQMFKLCCSVVKNVIKEEIFYGLPGEICSHYLTPPGYGAYLNPDLLYLRRLDLVSVILAMTTCGCNARRPSPVKIYVHLMRQHPRSEIVSMVPAQWGCKGNEYLDPIWTWSLFGPDSSHASMHSYNTTTPIATMCVLCNTKISVANFSVPSTTWLLIADIPSELHKVPVYYFSSIGSFAVGSVIFDLKFVVLYNTQTGSCTSMNLYDGQWYCYDDMAGGMLKKCEPHKVRYTHRINLRAFYFRRYDTNPHSCLKNASAAHQFHHFSHPMSS